MNYGSLNKVAVARLYYAAALRTGGDLTAADEQLKLVRDAAERIEMRGLKHDFELVEASAYVNQLWGQTDKSIKQYERVLLACPSCGWSARNLGEIYLGLGDKEKARQYLNSAGTLLPSDQRTKELLQQL